MRKLGILLLAVSLTVACTKEVEVERIVEVRDQAEELRLQQRIDQLENTISGLYDTIQSLTAERDDLGDQLSQAQTALTEALLEIDSLNNQLNDAAIALDEANATIDSLESLVAELLEQLEDAGVTPNSGSAYPIVDG